MPSHYRRHAEATLIIADVDRGRRREGAKGLHGNRAQPPSYHGRLPRRRADMRKNGPAMRFTRQHDDTPPRFLTPYFAANATR